MTKELDKILKGIKTEIVAGKSLASKTKEAKSWNDATDRCLRIIEKYRRGEGLFQQKEVIK